MLKKEALTATRRPGVEESRVTVDTPIPSPSTDFDLIYSERRISANAPGSLKIPAAPAGVISYATSWMFPSVDINDMAEHTDGMPRHE